MKFEVLLYKPLPDPTRPLQGFVDVLIKPAGFIVRGVRHIVDASEYVEFPVKWVIVPGNEDKVPVSLFEFLDPANKGVFKKEVLKQIKEIKSKRRSTNGQEENQ